MTEVQSAKCTCVCGLWKSCKVLSFTFHAADRVGTHHLSNTPPQAPILFLLLLPFPRPTNSPSSIQPLKCIHVHAQIDTGTPLPNPAPNKTKTHRVLSFHYSIPQLITTWGFTIRGPHDGEQVWVGQQRENHSSTTTIISMPGRWPQAHVWSLVLWFSI